MRTCNDFCVLRYVCVFKQFPITKNWIRDHTRQPKRYERAAAISNLGALKGCAFDVENRQRLNANGKGKEDANEWMKSLQCQLENNCKRNSLLLIANSFLFLYFFFFSLFFIYLPWRDEGLFHFQLCELQVLCSSIYICWLKSGLFFYQFLGAKSYAYDDKLKIQGIRWRLAKASFSFDWLTFVIQPSILSNQLVPGLCSDYLRTSLRLSSLQFPFDEYIVDLHTSSSNSKENAENILLLHAMYFKLLDVWIWLRRFSKKECRLCCRVLRITVRPSFRTSFL